MKTHALSPHHAPALPLAVHHRGGVARPFAFVIDRFLLLPIGAAIALVWANTAPESYFRFAHTAAFPINEVGMALFIALVVQEVFEAMMPGGALHTWRQWTIPIVAAAGGVAGAAGVYQFYVRQSYELLLVPAWPVACAIDVAAAYYVLKLIWPHGRILPFALLIGLATDALGLLIVAARPPIAPIRPAAALLMLAALGIAAALQRNRVRAFWPYFVVSAPLSWLALYWQGVHPALALVPLVPFLPREPRALNLFADRPVDDEIHRGEHEWNEIVQVVLFLFGLVNAGVILRGYGTGTWALLAAALVGRPLGILAAIGLAAALGLRLPKSIGLRELAVLALATSSGFTFALFLATGLIPLGPMQAEIKLGALSTVVTAGLAIGAARLLKVGRFKT